MIPVILIIFGKFGLESHIFRYASQAYNNLKILLKMYILRTRFKDRDSPLLLLRTKINLQVNLILMICALLTQDKF